MNQLPAIETKHLTKRFGRTVAVDALNLRIARGEVFGLLGPNGAGKTTTVRMLCGILAPTQGEAAVAGFPVSDRQRVARVVGLLPETPGLYDRLSVFRNLEIFAEIFHVDNRIDKINQYLRLLGLWDQRSQPSGSLSKGMRQKLALARALIHEPQILFLDEPTASLDPLSAKIMRELILSLKEKEVTFIICTHNLFEVEQICSRVGILSKGKLISIGTPGEIKQTISKREIVFTLTRVDKKIIESLRFDFIKGMTLKENKLSVFLENPEKEIPQIVKVLVQVGGEIVFITERGPSLEEVYLELTKEA